MILGLFIFRRDLRIVDNIALNELSKVCDMIIPIFILDPYQIYKQEHNQYYFSNNALQFMCNSLIDLNQQLIKNNSQLYIFKGNPLKIVTKLINELNVCIIGFNNDYSPYAINRDNSIINIGLEMITSNLDYSLVDIDKMYVDKGSIYKHFGQFAKKCLHINKPLKNRKYKFFNGKINGIFQINDLHTLYLYNNQISQIGGRNNALKIINSNNITKISAYLNFGCVSVREIYNNSIKDKLLWRDFYLMAYRFTPRAKLYNKHIDERYDSIKWKNNKSDWNKLIHSQTGFLLIDAIMKEMTITGFTNNRNRMLLGMFWTKYLIINPFNLKYGSQSNFSRLLVDAIGPSQNKMNHNWITDFDYAGKQFSKKNTLSGRPMDISNKIIKKHDPDCLYIKQWLPHLQYVDAKELIHWNYEIANINNNIHPSPMFDPTDKYLEWIQATKLKN